MEDLIERRGLQVAEHYQEGMRETIEALFQEHVTELTYREWYEQAVAELAETLEEGEAGVPLAEVQRLVTRRVLLHLADRTLGQVSVAMRNVASEFRKRGAEG